MATDEDAIRLIGVDLRGDKRLSRQCSEGHQILDSGHNKNLR